MTCFDLAKVASLLLLAACGGVTSNATGTGASDAGHATSATGVAAPHRDPRCPPTVPAEGDACIPTPAPLECEYGGDAFGECTTVAYCTSAGPYGPYTFDISPSSFCSPPNAAECPATIGAVPEGGTCDTAGLSCAYAEGVCGCVCAGTAKAWSCRSRSDVLSGVDVEHPPSPLPTCPAKRPLGGDSCAVEGQSCAYDEDCVPALSLGYSMQCESGFWTATSSTGECTASQCD
jgi:hypothetical protein